MPPELHLPPRLPGSSVGEVLLRTARESVAAQWHPRPDAPRASRSGFPDSPPADSRLDLAAPSPVFVTLWGPGGRLRGCVGTLAARCTTVVEETERMACEAAFADSRFPAVTREELASLRFEVSVVGPLEEVTDIATLDPEVWGIVVSTSDGRRGALLPDVEGIETVSQQLSVARRKGGIGSGEPARIQRFRVEKFRE